MEKSPERWWDIPSAVLLFLITLFSAWRMQSTGWTDGLEHVRNMALLGLFVGLALGQSKFQRRGVLLLSLAYMVVLLIWQMLGMIDTGREIMPFGTRLVMLFSRIAVGAGEFAANRPVKDQLVFVAIFCIPYWLGALISGYQLTRYANALAAVLPGGILMFIIHLNHFTTHDYSWLFGLYIFAAMILIGRQKYLLDRKSWRERHVQISSESALDISNIIMVSAAILIVAAWTAPSVLTFNAQTKAAWQRISKQIFPQNERLENIFAAAKKDPIPVGDFYRSELALGSLAEQSEEVAFLVYFSPTATKLPRLYWRGRVYNHFEAGRWVTANASTTQYKPLSGDFAIPDMQNRLKMSFTFNTYVQGQSIIYSAAQPLSVSNNASIVYQKIPGKKTMDIFAVQASPEFESGDTYSATSLMANPTIVELRAAGQEYPGWISEDYLQLPYGFSPNIRDLAQRITEGQETPYDKAAAITKWLRTEIKYSSKFALPKDKKDPLEYFLFESKQGFCNYYASAEVLMLRSVGVPARLAVGFAQGEENEQQNFFTVRERDAHAWPEVYFPGYGWIEFEPTGNQDSLNRPEDRAEDPAPFTGPREKPRTEGDVPEESVFPPITDQTEAAVTDRQNYYRIGLMLGSILLAVLAFFLIRRFAPKMQPAAVILKGAIERNGWESPNWLDRWVKWSLLSPIERSFHSINTGLRWMGKLQPAHVTPSERARLLMEILPSAAPSIETLLREHQSALFSQHGGDAVLSRRAARDVLYQTASRKIKSIILRYN